MKTVLGEGTIYDDETLQCIPVYSGGLYNGDYKNIPYCCIYSSAWCLKQFQDQQISSNLFLVQIFNAFINMIEHFACWQYNERFKVKIFT